MSHPDMLDARTSTYASDAHGRSIAPAADAAISRALGEEGLATGLEEGHGLAIEQSPRLTLVAALRHPYLHRVAVEQAAQAHVQILEALDCIRGATVWRVEGAGVHLLAGCPTRASTRAARDAIAGQTDRPGARVRGTVIDGGAGPLGAVVVSLRGDVGLATSAAFESARALAPVLHAAIRRRRDEIAERAIVETAERRLSRIGFDLHDGPLQDLALLRGSVRLLRRHLADSLQGDLAPILVGQVDDIDARVGVLNEALRTFVRSFESPTLLRRPFDEVVQDEVLSSLADAGMTASVAVTGDVERLTPSQRIAVFRIVQEALSNVRQHSHARNVSVSIVAEGGAAHLSVADDGVGFDVARTMDSARRRGRVGLLAMGERARLLGGSFFVTSASGGPTTVIVDLPNWESSVPER